MKLVAGSSNFKLTESLSGDLGIPLIPVDIQRFPDGEFNIKFQEDVVDERICVVQSLGHNINEYLVELLSLLYVLREKRVQKIITVIPYCAYARQSELSSFVTDLVQTFGVDHILTLDLHCSNAKTKMLRTTSLFAKDIQSRFQHNETMVIISPDTGGSERAKSVAEKLNRELVILNKVRKEMHCIQKINADVKGQDCIIIDDIVDSGATLLGAAKALKEAGAREIHAYVTHAVLSGHAAELIKESAIASLTVTDSIQHSSEFRCLSVVEIIGQAIKFFI